MSLFLPYQRFLFQFQIVFIHSYADDCSLYANIRYSRQPQMVQLDPNPVSSQILIPQVTLAFENRHLVSSKTSRNHSCFFVSETFLQHLPSLLYYYISLKSYLTNFPTPLLDVVGWPGVQELPVPAQNPNKGGGLAVALP